MNNATDQAPEKGRSEALLYRAGGGPHWIRAGRSTLRFRSGPRARATSEAAEGVLRELLELQDSRTPSPLLLPPSVVVEAALAADW